MRRRRLITALLLLATGCTSQPQTTVSEQPSPNADPKTADSAAAVTSTVVRNELPQVVIPVSDEEP